MLSSSSIYRNEKLRSIFQIECVHREIYHANICIGSDSHGRPMPSSSETSEFPVRGWVRAAVRHHLQSTPRHTPTHSKFTFPVPNMAAGFPKPTVKRKRFAARFTFSQSLNSRCNLWRIAATAAAATTWIMYLNSQHCRRWRCRHRRSRSEPKESQIKVKDKAGLRSGFTNITAELKEKYF